MEKRENLHVVIVSPERTLYAAQADSVNVPGEKGRFEILRGHAPIISSLLSGEIVVNGDRKLNLTISGGFIEVCENEVSLCVETLN